MIKWEDIKLPDEWDLPNDMPPTPLPPINISETDNLNSVEQYLDGTVKIRFDHSKPRIPPMIKYNKSRHSFSSSSSVSKREREINEHLRQLNLDKQKDIKQKGVKEENTQVNSAYYSVDNQPNKNTESDNESLNPTPSDMDGEIDNQLNLNKQKDIKQKGIKEENTQVNSAYYSVDNQPNKNIESDNESLNRSYTL